MRSPIRLVRNVDAARLFDTFLVTAIATVLLTRLYLHISGYPQIGSSTLHIAHLLPGGLLMMLAILIMIGSVNRSSRDISAFIGGIGFGLFWDELGKFITRDHDYFYQPAVAIMYVSFVGLYLITRYVIRRSYHPHDYLANALDLAMEGAIGELDPREYQRAVQLLQRADPDHPMYAATVDLLEHVKPTKAYRPFITDRLITWLHWPFRIIVRQPWYRWLLVGLFCAYGIGLVGIISFAVITSNSVPAVFFLNPSADTNFVAAASSILAGILVVWGIAALYQRNMAQALRRFESALLINIFVTQIFLFLHYQFMAVLALCVALGLLFSVRMLLSDRTDQSP